MISKADARAMVMDEYDSAVSKFPRFNGAHEGYAVVLEEVEEMWAEVKANEPMKAIEEAIQVAAMAVRFITDVSEKYGIKMEDWE